MLQQVAHSTWDFFLLDLGRIEFWVLTLSIPPECEDAKAETGAGRQMAPYKW